MYILIFICLHQLKFIFLFIIVKKLFKNAAKVFNWHFILQSNRGLGCIFTGQHEICSTIWFFGSLITKIGVFSGRYFRKTLKFAKTIPKKGVVCIIDALAIWVSRFSQELVYKGFLGRWSRIWGNFLWIINISPLN